MKAVVTTGHTVALAEVPKPMLIAPHDVIVQITSTTICGSDLHLYHHRIPQMKEGDVLGHEAMGIITARGNQVTNLNVGDRVVISAIIACGKCDHCRKEEFSLCDETNHPKTRASALMKGMYGDCTAGIFGHSQLLGGYQGLQAEFARVPFAETNCLKLPNEIPEIPALFLSDVLATSFHACELGNVRENSTVAVWGCGPIGLAIIKWCQYRKASTIIAIDHVSSRLQLATKIGATHSINYSTLSSGTIHTLISSVPDAIRGILPKGPDVAIDAVGFRYCKSWSHFFQSLLFLETDSSDTLTECIQAVRKGGVVVPIGDYIGVANQFPIGALMEKSITLRGGQVPVQKYWRHILQLLMQQPFSSQPQQPLSQQTQNPLDFSFLASHVLPLDRAEEAYQMFDRKDPNVIKIVLKPSSSQSQSTQSTSSSQMQPGLPPRKQ